MLSREVGNKDIFHMRKGEGCWELPSKGEIIEDNEVTEELLFSQSFLPLP